ncbi:hypothetical protein FisN_1Lh486 [Fistulifera solaris]|uniref:Uncharacterized protein n=1 Tax=Fistulifera solaris TaxID=1519565 RepID=A0A1Z5K154_FISSO|nr:hypothetical protein FisN_1Lh486 [Fistulifera solaris]|eukprot:GAX20033.1 hypothetical protein FisN_1Lh486 [Fistulifera solaris]
MASRAANLGVVRLPENLRKKMNSPDPLFSPSVTRGANDLHCMFSPEDVPSDERNELQSINEKYVFNTDTILSPEKPAKHTRVDSRLPTSNNISSPEDHIKRAQMKSPDSIVSQSTIESFKTAASIDMLSLPFIERCTSEEKLEQIVRHLKEDSNYPSLLCSAEQRLAIIRGKSNQPDQFRSSSDWRGHVEKFMMKEKSGADQEISLQMSLSTDYDEDSMSPINQIFVSKPLVSANMLEYKAKDEVQHLEEMIKKLEIRYARECKLNESTILTLNNAIQATEQKSQRLQNEVNAIKNENVELCRLIKEKSEEVNKVQTILSGSESVKHELLSQINQLKTQLAEAEKKALDRTYPRKIHSLEKLLQSAQESIKEVQLERDSMLKGIFEMQGKDIPSKLSKNDRQQIISGFRAESNFFKVALEKTMVSLAHAEQNASSERHRAKMIKQKYERQLKEASAKISELEEEVAAFVLKMEKLEMSLKDSQQRRLKEKSEWEARENRYKEKVRELNQQPNGVPMSLFKIIKDESEARKLEIQRLRKKSTELESTLLQWDIQAKASMAQVRSQMNPLPVSQGKMSMLQSNPQQKTNANDNMLESSNQPSVPATAFTKNLAIQTHSPRQVRHPQPMKDAVATKVSKRPDSGRVNVVFSGTQLTPHGSKKIHVATIPVRGEPVSEGEGKAPQDRPVSMGSQAALKVDTTNRLSSVRSDKENQGNKVSFSFPTPCEKGQTGHQIRLKMVREAGGRKGLLEKLEKMRSPRSSMFSMDEKATQ